MFWRNTVKTSVIKLHKRHEGAAAASSFLCIDEQKTGEREGTPQHRHRKGGEAMMLPQLRSRYSAQQGCRNGAELSEFSERAAKEASPRGSTARDGLFGLQP